MLNIIGLVAGFLGALCLLVDPSSWLIDDYTWTYIRKKKAILTVHDYCPKRRRQMIAQLAVRWIGLGMIVAGFGLQLAAALNAQYGPWW